MTVARVRVGVDAAECGECGLSTRGFNRAQWSDPDEASRQAIAAWNRRAYPADGVVKGLPELSEVSRGAALAAGKKLNDWISDALRKAAAAASPALAATSGGGEGFLSAEARAEAWSDRVEIQHMVEVSTGVFAKWASPELLSRFRQQMMAVIQQAYIEGCGEAQPAPAGGGAKDGMWWFDRTGMTPSEIVAALSPPSADADKLLIAREALEATKDRVLTWPIEDHETCMCGSPVEGHNIGSGHSPVSQGGHAVSMIVEAIDEALARLSTTEAGG